MFIIEDTESANDLIDYILQDKPKYTIQKNSDNHIVKTSEYEVIVPEKYSYILEKIQPKSQYDNPLIFGKDTTEGIVAIEVVDRDIEIYFNDGSVEKRPMIYWLLADKKLDKNFEKLEGDLHYKYIRKFRSQENFRKFASIYKKRQKDIYTIWNPVENAMIYQGLTMFKGLKVEDVSVLSFDIEANGLTHDKDSKVFLITNTFRATNGTITKKHFRVDRYNNDVEMIKDWCKWVQKIDPTILTGHNFISYDIPYLNYCYGQRNGNGQTLPLGKYGESLKFAARPSEFRVDGAQTWTYHKIQCKGRHLIDGMFLAVKYDIGRNYPSWGLKAIAEYEGFVKENRQFYDASKIGENWSDPVEREKIVAYGIDDSDDSLAIYDLMIPSIFYMTQSVPKNFQQMGISASGSQLNAVMVRAYLQQGMTIPKADEPDPVAGGISFGVTGLHRNVLKIDLISLYPSIIRQYRVSPLKKDPLKLFTKMVDYFTEKRFEQKRLYKETGDKYYNDLQAASKIFINSSYGMTNTKGLNFNDYNAGAFIPAIGRQVMKKSLIWATGKGIENWFDKYNAENDLLYDGELEICTSYEEFAKRKKIYES